MRGREALDTDQYKACHIKEQAVFSSVRVEKHESTSLAQEESGIVAVGSTVLRGVFGFR